MLDVLAPQYHPRENEELIDGLRVFDKKITPHYEALLRNAVESGGIIHL